MKTILLTLGIVGVLTFTLWNFDSEPKISVETSSDKEMVMFNAMKQYLDKFHYSPKPLDDNLSEDIYTLYLERIDGNKRFLIAEDVKILDEYKHKIDDEIKNNSLVFFDASVEVINKAIERAKSIYDEVIEEEFDFDIKEQTELNPEKIEFARDKEELTDYWRKMLKTDILARVSGSIEKQEEEGYDGEVSSLEEIIENSIEKTKETFDKWWNNMDKVRRTDWLSTYFNSIAGAWDPHTTFLMPKDKEDFDMRLSKRLEGIGAQLTMDGNYTKIVNLVPGGPAWKQDKLKADDLILKVEQEDGEAVDVVGMHIDDVVSMIRGEKGTVVILHVKHIDGSLEEIAIERDVIVFEEGYAKSLILEDSMHQQKIGYINLPSFYTDFNNADARSSSTDVRMELEKLNKTGVDGVILDLRDNGGGSLRDVVEMAGLFLESGPIVQVKSRTGKPYVYEDTDKSVVYDGPLIVLVNHFSASASEIMAAAMQDYGRGVIVGAASTFGKGTVQRIYDLDRTVRGHNELKPLGSVKITTQKYYRVDGGTVQLKGVIPDIILPDKYNRIDVGEKDYKYVMDWTEIEPTKFSQEIYTYNIPALRENSQERVEGSEIFKKLDEESVYIKERKNSTLISLNLDEYRADKKVQDEKAKKFSNKDFSVTGLTIENLPMDLQEIQADSTKMARNDALLKNIGKDLILSEALNIMHDILQGDGGKVLND